MTEQKKAILLTAEEHNAHRVYDSGVIEKLQERYDLYETVLSKKSIKNHRNNITYSCCNRITGIFFGTPLSEAQR